jgi:hypothetical protein
MEDAPAVLPSSKSHLFAPKTDSLAAWVVQYNVVSTGIALNIVFMA